MAVSTQEASGDALYPNGVPPDLLLTVPSLHLLFILERLDTGVEGTHLFWFLLKILACH